MAKSFYKEVLRLSIDCFVVMIDIDDFKQVNDTFGHSKGDEVIQFVSKKISEIFSSQLYCRFGGKNSLLWVKQATKMRA